MRFPKLITALLLSIAAAAQAGNLDPVAHANLADRLIDTIVPANNKYNSAGAPTLVQVEGVNGAADSRNVSVCAPFVTEMMRQAAGKTSSEYKLLWNSTSPSSAVYHDAIVAGTHFVRKTKALQIARGDVIAIKYACPGESVSGHTMMALAAPEAFPLDAYAAQLGATAAYKVLVADSSSSKHSFDSRDSSGTPNGAGRGYFRIYVDASGDIKGYTWTLANGSSYYDVTSCRHIAVGTPF